MTKQSSLTLKQFEEELTKKYGEPGTDRERKMFEDMQKTFEQRARELISEIEEISDDIMVGYIERIESDSVLAVFQIRSKSKGKHDKLMQFSYQEASRYGKIEEQLPIALIEYRLKGDQKYQKAFIPFDINAPKTYVQLVDNLDFSVFDKETPKDK